ncbi:MAG: hypothetical protein JWP84_1772 [Tardiphaga sp.]|nr:hypothetical protein [Tardiphaga sp.]
MMAVRRVMDGDGYNGVDKNYSRFMPQPNRIES